ncbi:MAG: SusF/SusE family outer membrane protein [Bacteroidaceae bacterium]|nr:SusF/SusE family outer membrane protein [Bacteroidaceae bacterium]
MKKLLFSLLLLAATLPGRAADWFINGDATPIKWTDNENKHRITAFIQQGEGTYVWIGKLVKGSEGFKIGQGFTGWGDYHPSSAGLLINDVGTDNIVSGGSDTKWKVSADGVYKLTITEGNPNALKCEAYTPSITKDSDGYYQIGTAADLFEFAELVSHQGIPADANAKLTADIDYTAYPRSTIGRHTDIEWAGTFDGQGHKITIALHDWMERTGLFSYCYRPTIKNLWVDGTINMGNHNCAGGLGGRCDGDGTRIDGVLVTVTINDSQSGDGTHGGLFANVENNDVVISNCAFFGSINAPDRTDNGGLVGWCGSGANITFKNCLIAPSSISWSDGATVGRNQPSVSNCYYKNVPDNTFAYATNSTLYTITDENLASGVGCYSLNENVSGAEHWYQTLNSDTKPFPIATNHSKLYANGWFKCDRVTPASGETTFGNTDNANYEDHTFGENNLCSFCKAVGEEPTNSNGTYQIGTIGHLVWFATHVNSGSPSANAVLTSDIAQGDAKYVPIGTEDNIYVGHFDGQGHKVNLALTSTGNYQGLFGVITDGVFIEKVIVTGSVSGNSYVGGIAGGTKGGTGNAQKTNIWYCGNEATITATGNNAGGILGVNMVGSASIILTNCYNTGNITGGGDSGALSGWLGGGWSAVRNCYNTGIVKIGDVQQTAFGRNGGCSFTNCYYSESSGTNTAGNPTMVEDSEVASGALCAKLGYGFRQNLSGAEADTHPSFNFDHGFVAQIGEAGYSTMYNIHSDVTIPEGIEAYAGEVNGTSLTLIAIENKIAASEPVVLKLAEGTNAGLFNFMPTTDASKAASNNLKGSTGNVTGGDGIYALALKGEPAKVGFYPVGSSVTIPEGKAYLEYTGSGAVKGFTFVFDDDATGISLMEDGRSKMEDGAIYNVAGQRLNKMQRGINIVNGKKILK